MMMGTGVDLCAQARIETVLGRYGMRFCQRICTPDEISFAEQNPLRRVARYSQFFAAKEACSKALGTGIRQGVFWRDMEMVPLASGKPTMRLHHGALQRMQSLAPANAKPVIELSLSDEAGLTIAFVVLYYEPKL